MGAKAEASFRSRSNPFPVSVVAGLLMANDSFLWTSIFGAIEASFDFASLTLRYAQDERKFRT